MNPVRDTGILGHLGKNAVTPPVRDTGILGHLGKPAVIGFTNLFQQRSGSRADDATTTSCMNVPGTTVTPPRISVAGN